MMRRIEHSFRVCTTGLSFVLFGAGAVVISIFLIPVLCLCIRERRRRVRAMRLCVHHVFRLYRTIMIAMGVIGWNSVGTDVLRADEGVIVIANHPTLLDVVLLLSIVKNGQCIIKAGVWHNPFMRWIVSAAGYIRNDGSPEHLLATCTESLQRGDNLIIFPEGSRTRQGEFPVFQRGVAQIALRAAAPIRVVTISCVPGTLRKGQKWHDIPQTRAGFTVHVHELVEPEQFFSESVSPSRGSRYLTRHLLDIYRRKMTYDGLAGPGSETGSTGAAHQDYHRDVA